MTNKDKTFDCIVFGEIIYDIYNNITQLGGAPLNYSWYLSQFGVKALLISSVGQDLLGEKALEQLNSTKLISPAITMRDSKTGTAEIIGTTKDPDFIINKDVAWDKINLPLNIEKYKTSGPGFIIIDIDDYRECLKKTVGNIKNYIDYPIYGLISKMDREIQKNTIEIGFDIIMTKSNFLYNIKTIKKQIINASRIS